MRRSVPKDQQIIGGARPSRSLERTCDDRPKVGLGLNHLFTGHVAPNMSHDFDAVWVSPDQIKGALHALGRDVIGPARGLMALPTLDLASDSGSEAIAELSRLLGALPGALMLYAGRFAEEVTTAMSRTIAADGGPQ
jgi:hypothetical protein